jgi:hypothetical protein
VYLLHLEQKSINVPMEHGSASVCRMYIRTDKHACMHTHAHTYTHMQACTHMHIKSYTNKSTTFRKHLKICHTCTVTHTYIQVGVPHITESFCHADPHAYIHIYIHTYRSISRTYLKTVIIQINMHTYIHTYIHV